MAIRPIDANAMLNELKPLGFEAEHSAVLLSDVSKIMREWVERQPTLTPPNEWVSVEERLPEHLKDVIALYRNGRIDIDWVDSSGDFKFGSLFDGVTHWMPLPAPPDRRPPEGEEDT